MGNGSTGRAYPVFPDVEAARLLDPRRGSPGAVGDVGLGGTLVALGGVPPGALSLSPMLGWTTPRFLGGGRGADCDDRRVAKAGRCAVASTVVSKKDLPVGGGGSKSSWR
ncbi:hypothetical protein QFC21_004818 [Naganishia friedmannii]|uniref:Uncharacterized protein n=1 Tax=Naganishia friedmannii TaxID=89922 RepID=A0ACC2VCN3_9TREE|nr:hypothetical protein QFC21_004818 [Naganishia friedmannii]